MFSQETSEKATAELFHSYLHRTTWHKRCWLKMFELTNSMAEIIIDNNDVSHDERIPNKVEKNKQTNKQNEAKTKTHKLNRLCRVGRNLT